MASKIKADQFETLDGNGNITLNNSVTMAATRTLPAASLTGTLPAIDGSALTGAGAATLSDLTEMTISTSDPTVSTNPSAIGAMWINKTLGKLYVATNVSAGANVWTNVGGRSGNIS